MKKIVFWTEARKMGAAALIEAFTCGAQETGSEVTFFPEWHEYPRLPRVLRWRQGSCKSLCPEGRHAEDLPRLSRDGHCRARYALILLDDTCIRTWEIHLIRDP